MRGSRLWLLALCITLLLASTAGAEEVPGTPTPAPQWFIDVIDADLEANTGVPVLTDSNDNAITWVADTVAVLDPSEALRFRLYSYVFSDPDARDCATYEVTAEMTIRADGPDAGVGDNNFMGIANPDFSVAAGDSYLSPAVGETESRMTTVNPTAAQLRDGLFVGYGATTVQRDSPDISSGYTFGVPTIDVTEDDSGCPPPPTTTTTSTTTSTTTTTTTTSVVPTAAAPDSGLAGDPAGTRSGGAPLTIAG